MLSGIPGTGKTDQFSIHHDNFTSENYRFSTNYQSWFMDTLYC